MSDHTELLAFARRLASTAENEILPRFRNCSIKTKPDGTEVTDADRAAEKIMREEIDRQFPDHAILGEEFGDSGPTDSTYRWVLDPIDGTASFVLGVPLFGTLIAVLEDGEPVIGVIHFPALGETVYAARGSGCWFQIAGEEPIPARVDGSRALSEATVSASGIHATTFEPDANTSAYHLDAVIERAAKFRFVSDCTQHALVCRGTLHAAIDTIMSPWDVAALVPCIEEAGGVVSDLRGSRENVVFGGSLLTSANEEIHREVLALLKPRNG